MNEVERFYDGYVETEWTRLSRHRVEFGLTMRAASQHLPAPPATVADIGGGPGRYAIALRRRSASRRLTALIPRR